MSALTGTTVLILFGVVPVAASAQQFTAAPLVFNGVTVVDVEQGKLVPDQRVVIVGNRIQTVGKATAVKPPKGAQIIDARGKYLIPGLWDLHVHLAAAKHLINTDRAVDIPIDDRLFTTYRLLLANGVTGLREPAAGTGEQRWDSMALVRWRGEIAAGRQVGPPHQIFSEIFMDPSCAELRGRPESQVCDSVDARHLVDSLKAAGVDMLKLYSLSAQNYFTLARAARQGGLRAGGHARGISPLAAADSGVSIIDHIGPNNAGIIDSLCFAPRWVTVAGCQPVAERFRQHNTWSVPTLLMFGSSITGFGDSLTAEPAPAPALLTNAVIRFWSGAPFQSRWLNPRTLRPMPDTVLLMSTTRYPVSTLRVAAAVGLPIAAGTDAPWYKDGFALHTELALLVDRGLTPAAALRAATLNPARLLRATDSLGTVAAGKLADLVLLDANPLADITNTTTIRAVVANGRYFDRAALDQLLVEARQHVPVPKVYQGKLGQASSSASP